MGRAGYGRWLPMVVVGVALGCGGEVAGTGTGLLPEPPPGGEGGGSVEELVREYCAAELACVGDGALQVDDCVNETMASLDDVLASASAACQTALADYYGCLLDGMVCRVDEGEAELTGTTDCPGPAARVGAVCEG